MMARQMPARASLAAAVAGNDAMLALAPGEAVRRLQAISGTVPSGDRTLDQVRAQLRAFGVDAYEVQPLPPKGVEGLARERIRKWTTDQVEKGLGWLKRMNAMGYDVFIRPAAPTEQTAQPLVFVDDLDRATVDRMAADGFPFAVLNESSPGSFHGWIRIATTPLDRDEVSRAARMLAKTYGGDPAAADWRHYGRLAGTTNRKPARATPRGAPFVMLRASGGELAPRGEELLAQARQSLDHDARIAAQAVQEAASARAFRGDTRTMGDAVGQFQAAREAAAPARGRDESARDFSGAMSLLRRGYSQAETAAAIRQGSPDLAKRHPGNIEDYIERTVARAAEQVASTPGIRKDGTASPGPR